MEGRLELPTTVWSRPRGAFGVGGRRSVGVYV